MDPKLQTRLDQAAADYTRLAAVDVGKLVANVDKMVAAIEDKDGQTARQAWTEARAVYERCEIFTIKFPFLDSAIDSKPGSGLGFHCIEATLSTPGAALPLAESQELSGKVHTFQRVFSAEPIYAHGIIVGIGALALELNEGVEKAPGEDNPGGSVNPLSAVLRSTTSNTRSRGSSLPGTRYSPQSSGHEQGYRHSRRERNHRRFARAGPLAVCTPKRHWMVA